MASRPTKNTRLAFLERAKDAGITWQLCIAKTTELSTRMYFYNDADLHNFLATFFSPDDAEKILHHDGIAVIDGVQYTLYRV